MPHTVNGHGGLTNRELGVCGKPVKGRVVQRTCPNCLGTGYVGPIDAKGHRERCAESGCFGSRGYFPGPVEAREQIKCLVDAATGWHKRHLGAMAEHPHEVAEGVGAALKEGK